MSYYTTSEYFAASENGKDQKNGNICFMHVMCSVHLQHALTNSQVVGANILRPHAMFFFSNSQTNPDTDFSAERLALQFSSGVYRVQCPMNQVCVVLWRWYRGKLEYTLFVDISAGLRWMWWTSRGRERAQWAVVFTAPLLKRQLSRERR